MTWWQTVLLALLGTGGLGTALVVMARVIYQSANTTVAALSATMTEMANGVAGRALEREKMLQDRLAQYRQEAREDVAEQRAAAEGWRDRYDECDRDRIELRTRVESLEREVSALMGKPPPGPARRPAAVKRASGQ